MTIVAARPKVGKTTLLLYLAMRFALLGIPVLFLDTEMSGEEMASRELSNVAILDEHRLLAGKFYEDGAAKLPVVQNAVTAIKNSPFFYASIAGKKPEYAVSLMRQFRNQHVGMETINVNGQSHQITGKCAVFYDWLKLPAGMQADAKEYQHLGELCTMLKDAAKNLHLPVIAGAQQNRAAVGVKDEADHMENAEATISGSDRLTMFCSSLCILRNPALAMQEAIEAQFGGRREGDDSQAWLFNQLLQIIVQRQGREYRWGIPLYLDRGKARYEEVATPEAKGFIKDYVRNKRGGKKKIGTTGTLDHQPVKATNSPAPPAQPAPAPPPQTPAPGAAAVVSTPPSMWA